MFNYITADTHFGHIHINVYEPSRMGKAQMEGFRTFDKYMIDEWDYTVKENENILQSLSLINILIEDDFL